MQALFISLILLAALVVLVPMMFMVGAFYRNIAGTRRRPDRAPARPEDHGSVVDSRARPLHGGEVADTDVSESIEGMRGPTPPTGT